MTRTDTLDPPGTDSEPIAPASVMLARTAPPVATTRMRSTANSIVIPLIALLILLSLALAVFLFLPGAVERESPNPAPPIGPLPARTADTPGSETAPAAPFEALRTQKERRAAQAVLEQVLTRIEQLEARAVERWGAETLAGAQALAEQGDSAFLAEEYETAQALYAAASQALVALSDQGDTLASERLAAGFAALERGDAAGASSAFDLALALNPNDPDTRQGAARAAVTGQVLSFVDEARVLAAEGDREAAQSLIDQALALDAHSKPAGAFAEELAADNARVAFRTDMSAAYTALRAGRFAEAEAAFARAAARQPAAPEVTEGYRLLAAERFATRTAALQREAIAAEQEARWADAAAAYRAALEHDPTLAFARSGFARSHARAELDTALGETLAHPENLNQKGALKAARALLAQGRSTAAPDPHLAGQLAALADVLRLAVIPVQVTLVSDGFSEIRILREANLGRFTEASLALRPGRYVATGARIGYRDARVEFVVTPQGTDAPVNVQCTAAL